jgi:hypothetical protein
VTVRAGLLISALDAESKNYIEQHKDVRDVDGTAGWSYATAVRRRGRSRPASATLKLNRGAGERPP